MVGTLRNNRNSKIEREIRCEIMSKQQIESARTNIIDLLNDNMYNTALRYLEKLVDNLAIEDINTNERVCYQGGE